MKRRIAALLGVVLAGATGAAVAAEPKAEARTAVIQQLADCRKLADDSARLACFDKAAAALDQAEAKGDIIVVDREQVRKVRREAFGLTLPSISLFEKGEPRDEIDTLTGVVATARQDATGRWVIRLEDGGTWIQADAGEFPTAPKAGAPAKVRRGALGSYFMSVGGKSAFRAKRVE